MEKDSPEYIQLALSGRVWEDYHRPYDSEKLGYMRLQQENAASLDKIDRISKSMRRPVTQIAKQLVAKYAHQSVMIENNVLGIGDSHRMREELCDGLFRSIDMSTISLRTLFETPFPVLASFNPKYEKEQSIELRNHIIASKWIAETSPHHEGENGLDEEHVRLLSSITMKDLGDREGLYPWNFGPRIPLGQYRQIPIGVKSNPFAVFPYHLEVPACMKRYFQWRDRAHKEKKLHPLILACHATVYFLQIHPFIDGNGRVSRMMMHDYMLRQGYLPVYMMDLERVDYLRMIRNAAEGRPDEFVSRVLTMQTEFLYSYMMEYGLK